MTDADDSYEPPRRFAEKLAGRIRQFWRSLGYDVNVTIERVGNWKFVRSDLVNGLPRNWRGMSRCGPNLVEQSYTTPEPRARSCLKCGTPFMSEHFGNRLCDHCRRLDPAMNDPTDEGGRVRRK